MNGTVSISRMTALLNLWANACDLQPQPGQDVPDDTASACWAAKDALWAAYMLVTRDAVDAVVGSELANMLPVDVWPVDAVA